MNYLDIIKKLIGPINPIGESNEDSKRFDNLKEWCHLANLLVIELKDVSRKKNSHYHSMREIGRYADEFLINEIGINEQNKWNDAGVTQPTHKSSVLVITNEDGNVFYHVAQFHDGEWSTHSEILHYVTQWMELPELY